MTTPDKKKKQRQVWNKTHYQKKKAKLQAFEAKVQALKAERERDHKRENAKLRKRKSRAKLAKMKLNTAMTARTATPTRPPIAQAFTRTTLTPMQEHY